MLNYFSIFSILLNSIHLKLQNCQALNLQNKMHRSLRYQTQPNFPSKSQFLTPNNKQNSYRKQSFSQCFKKSPYIHNRFSLGHLNEQKSLNKIVVEQDQPKKPFFKLPKIVKQHLKDEQMDDIGIKVVKMKKYFYDPYGCSKSSKLQKVRIRKKIMGIGPLNRMILQHFELKSRKNKAIQETPRQQEEKYKIKIYGS